MGSDEAEEVVEDAEVVDGLPVVTEAGVLEERPTAVVSAVQATALACDRLRRRRGDGRRRLAPPHQEGGKKSRKAGPIGEIVSSRSFLVDVHLLRRD